MIMDVEARQYCAANDLMFSNPTEYGTRSFTNKCARANVPNQGSYMTDAASKRWYQRYPEQPKYNPGCSVNVDYETLPQDYPRTLEVRGPRQIARQLYTGVPNYYPYMMSAIPEGTLYNHDWTKYGELQTGVINGKLVSGRRLIHGQLKPWPLTNNFVREHADYLPTLTQPTSIKEWQCARVSTTGRWSHSSM